MNLFIGAVLGCGSTLLVSGLAFQEARALIQKSINTTDLCIAVADGWRREAERARAELRAIIAPGSAGR